MESVLCCVSAAFDTLQKHGGAITIDVKDYYTHVYALLWHFALPGARAGAAGVGRPLKAWYAPTENAVHAPLLLKCLGAMFHHGRQVPVDRAAAYACRLRVGAGQPPLHGR